MATKKTPEKASTSVAEAKPLSKHAGRQAELDRREKRVEAKMRRLQRLKDMTKADEIVGKQVNGFMDFLREQSVVGLAIGLVLGTQVKQLVDSLVINFFNPLIGLFLPGEGTLSQKVFTLELFGKTGKFGYGSFVMTLINFLIVAAIVYFVFKGLKLDRLAKKKEDDKPAEEEKKEDKKTTKKADTQKTTAAKK